jgi:hypothetical protein
MAEISITITYGMWKDSILTISPRGNGIEWTLRTPNKSLVAKVYEPTVDVKELYVVGVGEHSYLKKRFMSPWEPSEPLRFSKEDALRLYDYLCEQIEWSPSSLERGTAHPDLLAAKHRHSAAGRGGRRRTRRSRRL